MDHIILAYLTAVSLIAALLTVYDKSASRRKGRRRVKESTLLAVAAAGGAVAMLAVMRAVRHKTRHAKFMVGIPIMIVLQIAAVIAWTVSQHGL